MRGDILVIDDDPAIVQFVVDALEDHNYRVRGACNGKEGLKAILNHMPALVLLDLILPGMYGGPLIEQIWTVNRTLPIVLISAMPDRAKPLANLFGIEFIGKPFSVETLLTCVGWYVQPRA